MMFYSILPRMAHAYFTTGDQEEGITQAARFAEAQLGLARVGDPDLIVLRYGLFTVEDARNLLNTCLGAPAAGEHKAVIVAVSRIFHEAQNALLKLFEEPPQGVTLILALPAEGVLLPTLRSRLLPLHLSGESAYGEHKGGKEALGDLARDFLAADDAKREKLIHALLERVKSDRDEEKQQARSDAVRLVEDLIRTLGPQLRREKPADCEEFRLLLDDLSHFLPLLHTRSAPLKPVFEHLRLVWPVGRA